MKVKRMAYCPMNETRNTHQMDHIRRSLQTCLLCCMERWQFSPGPAWIPGQTSLRPPFQEKAVSLDSIYHEMSVVIPQG